MGKRQAIGTKNKQLNVTEPLLRFSKNTAKHLIPISGYIFKSSSPSCGIRDIPTFDSAGCIVESGPGLFAEEIMHTWPRLPVIDEVQLQNSKMRDNFIERVYAYQRWRELCTPGVTPPKLEKFHQQQRSVLLSHGANGLKTLDLVIEKLHKERPSLARILNEYERDFMQILKRQTTRQQHCRVLVHLLNKIKNNISIEECNRTFELIMDYRTGYSPWSAPVEAMKNLLSHTPYAELTKQIYLNPDPVEMILRGLNSTSRKPVGLSEQRIY